MLYKSVLTELEQVFANISRCTGFDITLGYEHFAR